MVVQLLLRPAHLLRGRSKRDTVTRKGLASLARLTVLNGDPVALSTDTSIDL